LTFSASKQSHINKGT